MPRQQASKETFFNVEIVVVVLTLYSESEVHMHKTRVQSAAFSEQNILLCSTV